MLKQEVVVPHFSQRPVAIVDWKMVGGRLGGGWLGVLVIVCATYVLVPHLIVLSARIALSAQIY